MRATPTAHTDPTFFDSFGPMDGIKRDTWEGGIREPTLVRWPGHVPAGTTTLTASQFHDWLPTFLELAGLPAPARTERRLVGAHSHRGRHAAAEHDLRGVQRWWNDASLHRIRALPSRCHTQPGACRLSGWLQRHPLQRSLKQRRFPNLRQPHRCQGNHQPSRDQLLLHKPPAAHEGSHLANAPPALRCPAPVRQQSHPVGCDSRPGDRPRLQGVRGCLPRGPRLHTDSRGRPMAVAPGSI